MERAHTAERTAAVRDDGGQISFGSLGREAALDMLGRTNIDELSDAECRSLLADMIAVMEN